MAGVGETFAHFRIERELHRGLSATVYLAVDTVLERRVLLKVLRTDSDAARQFDQFRLEALAYARLQHPNVVTLYEFSTWQNRPFLVLEFVDGLDLAELLRRRGPLPLDVALTISRDLFRGLAYAHEHGVLHRDLKPSNVLVAKDGWSKVADFGLAALVNPNETKVGGTAGTLAYLAPEVIRGEGATERSDLYSAGATLYEMLTGHRLFRSEDPATCARLVLEGQWEPVNAKRRDLPRSVVVLVHGLLSPRAEERPSSAKQVVESLNQTAAELNTPLRAETVRRFLAEPAPVKLSQDKRAVVGRTSRAGSAVLGALAVILLLAGVLGWFWHRRIDLPGNLRVVELVEPKTSGQPPVKSSTKELSSVSVRNAEQIGKVRKVKPSPRASVATAAERPGPSVRLSQPGTTRAQTFPARPASSENAWLVVRCTPWAEVELDGALLGTVSPVGQFRVDPGTHSLVLHHPDFPPCSLAVALKPAKRETLEVNLWARIAQLWLQVAPWAEIWVDGRHVDTTPLSKPLILAPGEHQIELRNPAFKPWRKTVRLRPGEKVTLRVSLPTGYWELVQ